MKRVNGFRWLDAGELLSFSARVRGCLADALGNIDPGQFFGAPDMQVGRDQLGSSSVPALMNAIAPYAGPWL